MGITVKTVITDTATGRMLRMMEEARNVSGKSTEDIVGKQTAELSKNLAKRCFEIAKPKAWYQALPATLGYRLRRPSDSQRNGIGTSGKRKRAKGNPNSIAVEIRARKAASKYLGACWLRFKYVKGKVREVVKNRGSILVKWPTGPFQKGSITLINKAKNKRMGEIISSQVHEKFGIVSKAMNDTTRNMIPYIRRKRAEAVLRIRGVK